MTPERRNKLYAVLNRRQANLTVLLENVFDPHNVSAVMRTCDSVGIQELYILNTIIPPHKKWGYRSSSSAYKWLTVRQFDNMEECLFVLRKHFKTLLTTHLAADAANVFDVDFTQSIALAFGNEQTGVSSQLLAAADGNFSIPQAGIIQSLNISVACAVTIYEAYRQKLRAGHYNSPSLPEHTRQQLLEQWGFNNEDLAQLPGEC